MCQDFSWRGGRKAPETWTAHRSSRTGEVQEVVRRAVSSAALGAWSKPGLSRGRKDALPDVDVAALADKGAVVLARPIRMVPANKARSRRTALVARKRCAKRFGSLGTNC